MLLEVNGLNAFYGQNQALYGIGFSVDDGEVQRALREVDLQDKQKRTIGTLSGGERSRVSLAIALLGSPDVLVLDEPTVGLDPVLRRDLWALFRRLSERGVSLLVSSHVMDEAARCDRLILMRDGAVLADATLDHLLQQTKAPDAEAAFLLLVDEAEMARRRDGWSPNPPRYTSGVLGKYAKLVQGAETGAITNLV